MHIIVIVCDTLRRDFTGCYGNDWIRTPHIDSLAAEATVFDRAYIGSFPTIPQRAELMTGHHVFHTTGWAPLEPGEVPFQVLLRQQGYVTAMITDNIQYMAPGMNYHQGFDAYRYIRGHQADQWTTSHTPVEYPCDPRKLRQPEMLVVRHLTNARGRLYEREWHDPQTVQVALDWLEHNYRQEKSLLYLDLFGIHEPWDAPRYYSDLYDDPEYDGDDIILPRYDRSDYLTAEEIKHVRACYAGMITMTDRWLGRLFDKLRLLGLWEDTAILFTSDHGWYHGEHGYMGKHTVVEPALGWPLYNEVARVPLFIKVPGIAGGRRADALVQPVDLAPTVMELGGAAIPGGLHGDSLLPIVRGQASAVRDYAICSSRLSEDPDVRVFSTITDGQWVLVDAGAMDQAELYNVCDDPQQECNVLAEHRDVAERLYGAYLAQLVALGTSERKLELRRR